MQLEANMGRIHTQRWNKHMCTGREKAAEEDICKVKETERKDTKKPTKLRSS